MPTLLSTWRLINSNYFNVLISIELWVTAACGKGPTICIVYHDIVKMNVESIEKQSWHVLFKVHIYENLLAGGSLKAIFL